MCFSPDPLHKVGEVYVEAIKAVDRIYRNFSFILCAQTWGYVKETMIHLHLHADRQEVQSTHWAPIPKHG